MLLSLSLMLLIDVAAVAATESIAVLVAFTVVTNAAVVVQGARVGSGRAVLRWSCSSWSGSGMTTRCLNVPTCSKSCAAVNLTSVGRACD